ncbi:MAG: long-chain fatty acid--CoA ligase [Pseudomonadales bacterium]|nr:long-chain fatty acid--CoA ligase [Pseudomonadales bacterium]
MQNNLGLFLSKRAFLSPNLEAYVDGIGDLRLTYAELNNRCNRVANALVADGICKGERVGLLLMNSAEFMEAYFALAKIGAVVVPLNWRLVADELEFILKDSGTERLIFGDEFLPTVAELHSRGDKTDIKQWLQVEGSEPVAEFATHYETFRDAGSVDEPECHAKDDDMLYIMYTSGTTGLPKGVVHTHHSAIWAVITMGITAEHREKDRYLACLPMFHVGALSPLAVNVWQGATSIVMRSFDPVRAWELIQQEKITTGLAVPAMLNFMLQVAFDQYDYSSLRWIMTGAAPVPVSLTEQYNELGIGLLQVYGLTESCGPTCLMDADNALRKPGSTGRAFFHTNVKIMDDNGQQCAPGVAGEIWVQGAHIMREYWHRPEATADTLVDGWLRTGDVATMDDEGFVTIQDRMKDMIISGGENVYPAEIEGVLAAHPAINDVAIIGQQSAKWGESPLAIIVTADSCLTESDVLSFCKGKLAGFKQPKVVEFIDEIPRNPSGKILKRLLREQFPKQAPA